MWHMGMRPIGQASPGRCGSAKVDSTGFRRRIPDSQPIPPNLSARDGNWYRPGESCPESAMAARSCLLSPSSHEQSCISPRITVG